MSRKYFAIAVSLLTLVLLPAMFAGTNAVILHVYQPVSVRSTVLAPGNYIMRFVDDNDRLVLIRDASGNAVGIFPVIAASRDQVTDNVEVDVQHTNGAARLSRWFLPGSDLGWQFVPQGGKIHTVARADAATVTGE